MVVRVVTKSAVEAIGADLRLRLFSGDLGQDAVLTESEVAATYEVARPTAKAAIEKLVAEGLLVRGANKSARVPVLGPEDVRDIYRSRAYLESEVLRRLAGVRAIPEGAAQANADIAVAGGSPVGIVEPDMRFHMCLVDALDSPRTSRMYRSLVSEVRLCMSQVQGRELLPAGLIHDEHALLLELIAAGDGVAAVALLEEHLGRARELLAEAVGGVAGPEARVPSALLP